MCRVTMGHPRVTIGHLRVTVGHLRVTIGHLRATMDHLRLTSIGYHYLNSLLPVSRYIDTALAEKGSHQKKNLQPKYTDTSKFRLLGKPTKKLASNPLF